MKKFVVRSLVLLSLVLSVAGCDTGTTTGEEKIVAEQYRGTFAYNLDVGIVLTENTYKGGKSYGIEVPAWTIENELYIEDEGKIGYFSDNNTFNTVSTTGRIDKYIRQN